MGNAGLSPERFPRNPKGEVNTMRPSRQKFAARILFFVLIAAGMTLPGGRLLAQGGEGPPFEPAGSWPELPAG